MKLFEICTQPLAWPDDAPVPEILPAEERERRARLVHACDRARYAQAHVFLRETLSRFAPVAPADWQFTHNEFGRPSIAGPAAGLGLEFNLSHTRDWAACVITAGVPCGIDIECVRPAREMMDIARTRFAPEEFRELDELAEDARRRRFFEMWTEKEAWVKACGKGLSLAIERVVPQIPGVTIERLRPSPSHIATAVLLSTGRELRPA